MSTEDYTSTSMFRKTGIVEVMDLQEYMEEKVNWKVDPEKYSRPAKGKFEPEEFMEDVLFALSDSRRNYHTQEYTISVFSRNGEEEILIKSFYEEVVDPSPLDVETSRLEEDSYPLIDSGSSRCSLIAKAEIEDVDLMKEILS
ncbi:MAG: hypothetical protein H8Z69_04570 [Nanohaloarchaea archaeon]|nr:hypothetical protein [Candidatus Nanohaloarchaea archaeon]